MNHTVAIRACALINVSFSSSRITVRDSLRITPKSTLVYTQIGSITIQLQQRCTYQWSSPHPIAPVRACTDLEFECGFQHSHPPLVHSSRSNTMWGIARTGGRPLIWLQILILFFYIRRLCPNFSCTAIICPYRDVHILPNFH